MGKGAKFSSRAPPEIRTNFVVHRSAGGILTELLKQKQWLGSMVFLDSLLIGVVFLQLREEGRLRNSRLFGTNFANLFWTMIKSMI